MGLIEGNLLRHAWDFRTARGDAADIPLRPNLKEETVARPAGRRDRDDPELATIRRPKAPLRQGGRFKTDHPEGPQEYQGYR